jgi:predicted permease
MLAVAIGLSAAMFTVADHMLIRPAPYPNADRLVWFGAGTSLDRFSIQFKSASVNLFRGNPAFASVQAAAQAPTTFESARGLENVAGARITPGLFEMLGVTPILGRTFVPGEGREGATDPIILSEAVWRNSFGADPALVGRTIRVSNVAVRVVGIMPEWFRFPFWTTKSWRPVDLAAPPAGFGARTYQLYGRLAPGATRASAAQSATAAATASTTIKAGDRVFLRDVADRFLDAYSRSTIDALGAGVGFVFLVLCANVANLVLARTTARQTEYSVASALGASRGRILRETVLESVLMGTIASAVGLGLAFGLTKATFVWLPASIAERTLNPIALDLRTVLAASAIGMVAVLIAGLPSAWMGTRVRAADTLRLSSRSSTPSAPQRRWTQGMLVAEIGLASTLLVGAGLLATSFVRLMHVDPGFDLTNVITASLSLPSFNFADAQARANVTDTIRRNMQAIPGIAASSLSLGLPPAGGGFYMGDVVADSGTRAKNTFLFQEEVGPGFFSVFGIRLLEGRDLTPTDSDHAVVIGKRLATMLWPKASPIGRSFSPDGEQVPYTVVGVATEVMSTLSDPTRDEPEMYSSLAAGGSLVMLGLRCAGPCPSEEAIRARLHEAEPRAVVTGVSTTEAAYVAQFEKPRAAASLAVAFAVVALIAAGGGLFSVLTYAVGRRRREFGVRVALGADPARLTRMVIGDGLVVAAIGLGLGSVGALALGRWLSSLAYGITLGTPIVWIAVVSAIVIATVAASWRPARAAAHADPAALLRDS